MRINLKVKNTVAQSMAEYSKVAQRVAKKTYTYFSSITPVRTGNARRNTRLRDQTIEANYNYAGNLDQGSSSQAPQGMSGPSIEFMEKTFNEEIKKLK